jgi:hypothetical protein
LFPTIRQRRISVSRVLVSRSTESSQMRTPQQAIPPDANACAGRVRKARAAFGPLLLRMMLAVDGLEALVASPSRRAFDQAAKCGRARVDGTPP